MMTNGTTRCRAKRGARGARFGVGICREKKSRVPDRPPFVPGHNGPKGGGPVFFKTGLFQVPGARTVFGGRAGPRAPDWGAERAGRGPEPAAPPRFGDHPGQYAAHSSTKLLSQTLNRGLVKPARYSRPERTRGETRGARRAAIAAVARPPAGTMRARRPSAALVAAGLLAAAAGAPRAARAQAEAEVVRFVYPAPPPAPDAELAESWTEDSRDGIYNLDWQGDPTLGVSAARNGGRGPVPPPAGTPRSGSASAGARRQWLGATRRSTRPPALHGEPEPEPRRRDGRGEPPPPHLPCGAFAAASTTPPWALGDSIARERPRATQRLRG